MRPFLRFHRPSYIAPQPSIPYDQNEIFGYRPQASVEPPTTQQHRVDPITTATSVPIQVFEGPRVTTPKQQQEQTTEQIYLRRGEEASGLWTTARIVNETIAKIEEPTTVEQELPEIKVKSEDMEFPDEETIRTTTEQAEDENSKAITTAAKEQEKEQIDQVTFEALYDRDGEDITDVTTEEATTTEDVSITTNLPSSTNRPNNYDLVEFLLNDMWNAALDFQKFMDSLADPIVFGLNVQLQSLQSLIENSRDKQEVTLGDANNINKEVISITTHISLQRLRSSMYVEKKQRLENLAKLLKFTVAAQRTT